MNEIEINPDRTIGQASAETDSLTKFLATKQMGEVITFLEMEQACKVNPQEAEHNGKLQTARRRLLKDGIVFGTVRTVGLKRLHDKEIPEEADSKRKRAKKQAVKGLKVLNCANVAKLSEDDRIKAITTRTVLGFMAASGSRKTLGLAEQAARSSSDLNVGKIENLFKK